jgi:hypothetical protein
MHMYVLDCKFTQSCVIHTRLPHAQTLPVLMWHGNMLRLEIHPLRQRMFVMSSLDVYGCHAPGVLLGPVNPF